MTVLQDVSPCKSVKNEELSPREDGNLLNSWENGQNSARIPINEAFSFTEEVRKPLILFMNITGLHDGTTASSPLKCYRMAIIGFIIFACIRRGNAIRQFGDPESSLGELMFNPNVVLSLARFLFCFCSFLTTIAIGRLATSRKTFLKEVDLAMNLGENKIPIKRGQKLVKFLIFSTIFICSIGAGAELGSKIYILQRDSVYISPLIAPGWHFLPLETYLALILQCSILLMAMDFFLSCTFLRFIIENLCNEMKKNFGNSSLPIKLQRLDEIQTHHHHLITARKLLEDCYSLIIFCYYIFIIPVVCFLAYICYRNAGKNPGLIYGLSIWISINILLLLILSFPAFQLTEEGENITNSVFFMHQNSFKTEEDPRITSKLLLLISQIHNNHITISAYNYFPLSRGILLTMFSAIFTYFLILVQFGDSQEENKTQQILKRVEEICRNRTGWE